MALGKRLVADSARLGLNLLKEQALGLFIVFVAAAAISLSLEELMHDLSRAQEDQRWMMQLALGLVDLFEGVAVLLLLSWGVPKVRPLTEAHFMRQPFQSSYLGSFLAEYLRVLAQVLLYSLLLLVPGFIRYGRLIFVPYVTLFAKPYRDDQVDALELSTALSRGRMPLILSAALVMFLIQIGLEILPQSEFLHSIPFRLLCNAISFGFSAWSYAFMYLLFEIAMEEHQWRSADGPNL